MYMYKYVYEHYSFFLAQRILNWSPYISTIIIPHTYMYIHTRIYLILVHSDPSTLAPLLEGICKEHNIMKLTLAVSNYMYTYSDVGRAFTYKNKPTCM